MGEIRGVIILFLPRIMQQSLLRHKSLLFHVLTLYIMPSSFSSKTIKNRQKVN